MSKLDLKTRLFLYITNSNVKEHIKVQDVDRKRNYIIGNINKNDVYIFENYDEYKKFFLMYLYNVYEDEIDLAIYARGKKGQIVALKGLCEHIIVKKRVKSFYESITKEQIQQIHSKEKLTPLEMVQVWEAYGLCAPGNHASIAKCRCNFFNNCHECLMELASHELEHEDIDFKIVNSINQEQEQMKKLVLNNKKN